jgi:hypothetical protein
VGLNPDSARRTMVMVPDGDISVMPQPCCMRTPRRRYRSSRSSGIADPPHTIRSSVARSDPAGPAWSTASQNVGTPAAIVTPSSRIRPTIAAGLVSGPASTRLAPASALAYGRPHAVAWKSGVSGRMTSRSATANESAKHPLMACRVTERWE